MTTNEGPLFDSSQSALDRAPLDNPHLQSGPFWAQLRTFLAVAKGKSFSRAATITGSSIATVSRQVKRLEDLLQCQLVTVSPKGIALTLRGMSLAENLLQLDNTLYSLSHDLKAERTEAAGLVTVTSTEALGGLFIVPSLPALNAEYQAIQIHLKNPVDLLSFKENECDVLVAFGPMQQPGLVTRPAGFLHLVSVATKPYVERFGYPDEDNLEEHRFVDAHYYASKTPAYAPWRSAVDRGTTTYWCDNPFSYGLMVKAGLGIGLLGNFTTADRDVVHTNLDIHVRLPIFVTAREDRPKATPVSIVFQHLLDVFSPSNPVFAPELNLASPSDELVDRSIERVMQGSGFVHRRSLAQ
jgi:DNA-binding transcriptional LysR family regulator